MTDFWLISVPLDRTSSQSLEKLKHCVAKTKLATSFKFSIPELKVGTLDVLLEVKAIFSVMLAYFVLVCFLTML
uniref:V-type proton ATPase subunit C n=1 Tax=Oncorhynchus kisutch TaxID=8019 RepID=A0A8C7FK35_ONCKI